MTRLKNIKYRLIFLSYRFKSFFKKQKDSDNVYIYENDE